jgi:hypothetical protein
MVKTSLQALTRRDRSQRIGRQFTNSSVVVPSGSLQVENGFLETSSQGQSVVDGPETLVRFGITKRTELRFTAPDYFLNTGGGPGSGFGDFAFGVKNQIGPTPGKFDVSLILFLSFPTGANTVSSGGYDPGLQVPCGWSLKPLSLTLVPFNAPTPGRRRSVCAPPRWMFFAGENDLSAFGSKTRTFA